ncbi:uncharacterized protein LOC111344482 isoform X1 [Stylophora pistillata]|uniref:Far upstream element-binding protein 1 n=1 Tax=Stylophora pistillata TaxID=50429 RepID=A0A2B4REH3_STYPI|nr:uncharacterized protein LOC111344482 isoform X1 [Stylophora pistillata]PFX14685.1 Far upstream element-binding protein 1 [Stylophora pistillata]
MMSNAQRPTAVTRVIPIPKDKVGHVIGRRGSRIREIREQTGVQISINKENQAHLRGTVEQCQNAEKIIEEILTGAHGDEKGGYKKLHLDIPEKFMGIVIGKGYETLNYISTKTDVTLRAFRGSPGLYFKGSSENEKKAIREIKAIVNLAMKRSRCVEPPARFVYVDTAQLEENYEFELQKLQLDQVDSGRKSFQLKLLEHPLQEETADFADTDSLSEKIRGVLGQIHKEREEGGMVRIDMWSHFGHVYITAIDEEEEEETFTLKEIKEKIESTDGKNWKPFFKEGVKRIEVEAIEKGLESNTATEDIRYDFTFYTPSCRDIRVKAWLVKEHSEEEGTAAPSLVFSRSAPITVKNVLTRVLSEDKTGSTSNEPCFHMCSQFQQRMRADILIPSKGFDCRLSIRTCPNIPQTPEAEEEDRILESYLINMKIDQGQLKLPPNSELPDGFELFYHRRSLRKTYQCQTPDGEQFALTICKDQAKDVNTDHTDVWSFDETEVKTDIHVHCEEWDKALEEGDWEPEQIVAKLPTFLKFLRQVQSHVAPNKEAHGDEF